MRRQGGGWHPCAYTAYLARAWRRLKGHRYLPGWALRLRELTDKPRCCTQHPSSPPNGLTNSSPEVRGVEVLDEGRCVRGPYHGH